MGNEDAENLLKYVVFCTQNDKEYNRRFSRKMLSSGTF